MKIDRIKISGVAPDVLGFAFAPLSVSWRVVDPEAEAVTETLIELSRDPSFLTVDYAKRGKLSAAGEPLDCALLPRTRYYLRPFRSRRESGTNPTAGHGSHPRRATTATLYFCAVSVSRNR